MDKPVSQENLITISQPVVVKRERWSKEIEFMLAEVGNAVGLGNFWRFPYLAYISGGGAFCLAYLIMLISCGIPLLYMELATGQFTQQGPVGALKTMSPFFQGVGMASIVLCLLFCSYYAVIMSWAWFYVGASCQDPLPWSNCDNWWNTDLCWDDYSENASYYRPNNTISPTQEYFENRVLQQSDGIEDPDGLVWYLVVLMLLTWITIYLCLFRGLAWMGKVVYFTVIFPYFVITALIIRGCTLPGAMDGLYYFIVPVWSSLKDPTVWVNATAQNFNSIGIAFGSMITDASYNKKTNSILKNVLWVCVVDAVTAFLAGVAVFSILGNIAYLQGQAVEDVVTSGPGLVFVVYPQAFVTFPVGVAQLFSFIFFLMLITLAIDSLFPSVAVIVTCLVDDFGDFIMPLLRESSIVVLIVCAVLFFMGFPCVTRGGIYYFTLIDTYSSLYSSMVVALFEVMAICWCYGASQLANDIYLMIGSHPGKLFQLCLCVVSPVLLAIIMITNYTNYEFITYDDYEYPMWSHGLGWFLAALSLVCLPIGMIKAWYETEGSGIWKKLLNSFKTLVNSNYIVTDVDDDPEEVGYSPDGLIQAVDFYKSRRTSQPVDFYKSRRTSQQWQGAPKRVQIVRMRSTSEDIQEEQEDIINYI